MSSGIPGSFGRDDINNYKVILICFLILTYVNTKFECMVIDDRSRYSCFVYLPYVRIISPLCFYNVLSLKTQF
jgi:hypothetical protein